MAVCGHNKEPRRHAIVLPQLLISIRYNSLPAEASGRKHPLYTIRVRRQAHVAIPSHFVYTNFKWLAYL